MTDRWTDARTNGQTHRNNLALARTRTRKRTKLGVSVPLEHVMTAACIKKKKKKKKKKLQKKVSAHCIIMHYILFFYLPWHHSAHSGITPC